MPHLVIIGGSDAGISAALRARELAPGTEVTVLLEDRYPNFSICGLPYLISGEVADWHRLAHREAQELTNAGINLRVDSRVTSVDAESRLITLASPADGSQTRFDRLIIATGARPVLPQIIGTNAPGVYPLRTMGDAFRIIEHLESRAGRTAAIVGGGYIGIELAEALTMRGIAVSLFEHGPRVMKTLDEPISEAVAATLSSKGVRVVANTRVGAITPGGRSLRLDLADHSAIADIVVIAVGVEPSTTLVRDAGLTLGAGGAIAVDARMATSDANIFAAGDCATTWHRITQRPTYLPLGTTAHKQGRIACENAVGGDARFAGVVGTQVVKVFDSVAARTGLTEQESRESGFEPLSVSCSLPDHKRYYPAARDILIRLTGDRVSGRLLGAQLFSDQATGVAKRIDVFATALYYGVTVDALLNLDLSYAPPLGSPWDPAQLAAETWCRVQQNRAN